MQESQKSVCGQTEHDQIMAELSRINKRMDDDWKLIEASNNDRIRREGIWNVLKWIGFSGISFLVGHLFT